MDAELRQSLAAEVHRGGHAHVRNLVAAEAAVLSGRFNAAKVLRASAHTQRILAREAARLLDGDLDTTSLFETILTELEEGLAHGQFWATADGEGALRAKLEQCTTVRERLAEIIRRSMTSVSANNDVTERDVPQVLWGCYACGYIAEGDRPTSCPICGALGVEFEWFGPFYSTTPEHLGQLTPSEILAILEAIPDQVEVAISKVRGEELRHKPSEAEWCVKEIMGHMLETDLLFAQRVRIMIEGQGLPVIPRSMPPWKLHEGKGYEQLDAVEILRRMRQGRAASLELLRGLEPIQWTRQGTIQTATASVLDLGTWIANHDRGHLAQIRELCRS